MNQETQYHDFWEFIKLLSDNELLDHVVVIGSWAEYLYAQGGVLPGFTANLRTLDIDFLVKNLRRPNPPASIAALTKEAGYLIESDYLDQTTKIYTLGGMEIEFLILQQGGGTEPVLKTNLGVNAQALRHLAVLRDFTMQVSVMGLSITVPWPEAYVLHKIIINPERNKKAEKDRAAIESLLPLLDQERQNTVYDALTKKEQRLADAFFAKEG